MTSRWRLAIFVCATTLSSLLAVPPEPTEAAVPSLLNFQGILLNISGGTVNDSTYTLTFRIYDDSTAGSVLWNETKLVTTQKGLFTTYLGSVNPITDLVFADSVRYLEIDLVGIGPYLPRSRIGSVAYAMRASTVDGASGGTIADDLTVTGGNLVLDNSSATSGNILKAGVSFIHNKGTQNTFVGINAGNLTSTGSGNTGTGAGALKNIQVGSNNTASGDSALFDNTTGTENTASGARALLNNTGGFNNTANGAEALYSNTDGIQNTATGSNSLGDNATGDFNTASGALALASNTSGNSNTATGFGALQNSTTSSENTATGFSALGGNSTGTGNTATGFRALWFNVTGNGNTADGYNALSGSTTGGNNTAVGNDALTAITSGTGNTAIGYNAETSAGNLTNATVIGADAVVNASNKVRLGNTLVTVVEGQVAYTFTSDSTQKENFADINPEEVLSKIAQMNLRSWNYKGNDPQQFRHYGPTAQEFFSAFGHDGIGVSGTPTTINSGDQAGLLMIAIQALERRTAENAELKKRVEALERLVQSKN